MKVWEIRVGNCNIYNGLYAGEETLEIVIGDDEKVVKEIERVKTEIEGRDQWWMNTHKESDGRPHVRAREITESVKVL